MKKSFFLLHVLLFVFTIDCFAMRQSVDENEVLLYDLQNQDVLGYMFAFLPQDDFCSVRVANRSFKEIAETWSDRVIRLTWDLDGRDAQYEFVKNSPLKFFILKPSSYDCRRLAILLNVVGFEYLEDPSMVYCGGLKLLSDNILRMIKEKIGHWHRCEEFKKLGQAGDERIYNRYLWDDMHRVREWLFFGCFIRYYSSEHCADECGLRKMLDQFHKNVFCRASSNREVLVVPGNMELKYLHYQVSHSLADSGHYFRFSSLRRLIINASDTDFSDLNTDFYVREDTSVIWFDQKPLKLKKAFLSPYPFFIAFLNLEELEIDCSGLNVARVLEILKGVSGRGSLRSMIVPNSEMDSFELFAYFPDLRNLNVGVSANFDVSSLRALSSSLENLVVSVAEEEGREGEVAAMEKGAVFLCFCVSRPGLDWTIRPLGEERREFSREDMLESFERARQNVGWFKRRAWDLFQCLLLPCIGRLGVRYFSLSPETKKKLESLFSCCCRCCGGKPK